MLAVKWTARTMGQMNKLMFSIMINIGMRVMVVPWGSKFGNEAFSLWRKPMIMAPFHNVIGITKFVDNFFVGLNVCGNSPRRSVDPINIIKDTSTSDHVLPLCDFISII